jgi:hypothetical protein
VCRSEVCVLLFIYQQSLHDARSTKYKTLEDYFYLHVQVSFRLQVTNVGVPLVDECWCKTIGKWISHRPTVINFIRRVWHALHLEKTHNWLRQFSVTVPIQGILRTEEGNTSPQYQPHIAVSALTSPCFDVRPRFGPASECTVSSVTSVEVRHTFVEKFTFFYVVRFSLFNPSKTQWSLYVPPI